MGQREDTLWACQPEQELPFEPEEFAGRVRRIRERLADERIDMLFLSAPESMFYTTGYQCEWYQAQSPPQWPATSGVAIHVDHDNVILFDTEREAVLTRLYTAATDTRIFPPASLRDGTDFIVSELAAEGWLPGTVGLELWSYRPNRMISERFEARLRGVGCTVVDGSFVVRELRWVKSPQEIACIEEAGRIADIGLLAARDALGSGVTELEVYGALVQAMAAAGGENPGITQPVLSGKKSNCAHALSSRKKIVEGDIVLVDVCGVYNRYHANMARTFAIGEPDPDVVAIANKAAGSMQLLGDLVRPDLRIGELADTMMQYYIDQGIWEDRGWIGGYEMGIAFPPDWVGNVVYDPLSDSNAERLFEPGTAVNYENQFFLPRQVGMYFMIETLVFVEEHAKLLSEVPYELHIID